MPLFIMQLQAGYFIEELESLLLKGAAANSVRAKEELQSLLHELSWFEVHGNTAFNAAAPEYDAVAPYAIWSVATNLMMRGLPTRAPLSLAAAVLSENWPAKTNWLNESGQLDFNAIDERGSLRFILPEMDNSAGWAGLLWRALHPLDPRLQPGSALNQQIERWRTDGSLDSKAEQDFAALLLPDQGGDAYLTQLLQPQTQLPGLLNWSANEAEHLRKEREVRLGDFVAQAADFTIAFPYSWQPENAGMKPEGSQYLWPNRVVGVVLEVDGPHHLEDAQAQKDNRRDSAALAANWFPIRLPVADKRFVDATQCMAPLREIVGKHPYFLQLSANYHQSLLKTAEGLQALQLTLGPLAVARVQRTLLEALMNGTIPPQRLPILAGDSTRPLRLAILERDVPCAQQGVALLLELLERLYKLEGKLRVVPTIELHVFPSEEFPQPTHLTHPGTVVMETGIAPSADDNYDLLLDVSILQRPGFSQASVLVGTKCLTIRTAHSARRARRFRSAPLIEYPALVDYDPANESYTENTDDQKERCRILESLVQDIFRKRSLRQGQLPIISRGLQGKSVLGLLPTGGGKSLTFQLAVLLQPGVALVVTPIKSLMQDQYEGLVRNWIDGVTYLNSSVIGRSLKDYRLRQLREGELLLLFVSPERLVIKEDFRDHLDQMRKSTPRVGFSYCVIDEAHCVSEWGHDFRTPYLKLGENARRFCGTYSGKNVPLYGLTATASFDVLADVQRELHLDEDQSAIIRTATMARPELHVRIVPVMDNIQEEGEDREDGEDKEPVEVNSKDVGNAKHERLEKLLAEIPNSLLALNGQPSFIPVADESLESNALPAFTPPPPFAEWPAGFYALAPGTNKLAQAGLIFCPHKNGVIGVRQVHANLEALSKKGLKLETGYFMGSDDDSATKDEDQLKMQKMQTRFVNSELNVMVATKAFGMGIDKPNVRFTVHYGYPGSIESFVQEAGRAGRDRAVALNYILYHPTVDFETNNFFFERSFKARNQEVRVLHELLTLITFPSRECSALNALLSDVFPEKEITARLYTRKGAKGPEALYLQDANGAKYGRIVVSNPQNLLGYIEDKEPAADSALLNRVVNTAVGYLMSLPQEARITSRALVEALGGGVAPGTIEGILPRLERVKDGEHPGELTIGFCNGTIWELCQDAVRFNVHFTEKELEKHAGATSGDGFANAAGRDVTSPTGQQGMPAELVKLFVKKHERIRLEADTARAIHRLCLLGVIEDYTIQYTEKTFRVVLAPKQTPDELRDTFQRYLARYTTPESAKAQAEAVVEEQKGKSLIEKYIGALLNFNDTEIRAKRERSILDMGDACKLGSNPNYNLSEHFDLYFNSKYARQKYLPTDTLEGKHFDQDLIWKYLRFMASPPDLTGKERDNIKHLRGACSRLLVASPHNGALLLLGAFSTLFLELTKHPEDRVNSLIESAQKQLFEGFLNYDRLGTMTLTELVAFVQKFALETGRYDIRIGDYVTANIEEPLQLQLHTRWLTDFTTRFCNITPSSALTH
ncbi:DEAD/DEAH box helicase [Hymenobacter cellulosivorans]|uniref:DNA 3'-5' helicase n=1 Tax=Hymenobacter cellulosivorans TaxID=2932249 RepID=A0ABY4FG22_9BACT|nr:DEAD/DEAH box helicase [Hymenobacter cellulosivorans]UOQ55644.1 DEAD/DEAH box helicase [Hymenobacter cellulosivorans]